MPKLERIPIHDRKRALPALTRHALAARTMLENVWDEETAFQGIQLQPTDAVSRGQCGVSALWFSRYLVDQRVDAHFVEGTMAINGGGDEHVWVEARNIASQPIVIDVTTDQYQTIHGTKLHIGVYGDEFLNSYEPRLSFEPYSVPHKKLLARYALLQAKIASLPRRHRLR